MPELAPRLYTDLAGWYHLLTAPSDYAEEAAIYRGHLAAALTAAAIPGPWTLLELGSGGGANASFLKEHFTMTLSDVSPEMLAISRSINPQLEHVVGDMRDLRLDRQFDAVFVHDALSYLRTDDDLRRAIATVAAHCRPGGVALLCPDDVAERLADTHACGGHDGADGRGVRYLEWSRRLPGTPADDPGYVADYVYMLRDASGSITTVSERHHLGAHPRARWLELLDAAGFDAEARPFLHSEVSATMELFVGRKRATA
ncbi:MAG: methyltransferase domain-containing protein [Nannocystaceae bacterium]